MIWIFGLVTGLAFDMPTWWWVLGFFLSLISTFVRVEVH